MDKFTAIIEKYQMLPKDALVLAAVSGGADSMCMLALLRDMELKGKIRLAAAHFDHSLRGEESDRDAAFVREFCRANDIVFYYGAGDVRAYANEAGLSLELAAREKRYEFLQRTAARTGADRIATAHTASDNAETVIFNLARGAGLNGLSGIAPVRGNIVRPMLWMTREEVEKILSERGLPHVEDSTNAEDKYTRNRIRHRLVPLFRELNPSFAEGLSGMAERLRADERYLDSLAEEAAGRLKREDFVLRMPASELLALPEPVAARLALKIAKILGAQASADAAEGILALAASDAPSARRSFAGGLTAMREYGDVLFSIFPFEDTSFVPAELRAGERTEISGLGLTFTWEPEWSSKKIHNSFNTFLFKSTAVCGTITVRPRKSGDKLAFGGGRGTKTLKKLFIDEKVPQRLRAAIPVMADEKGVIAVLGFGTDERCMPEAGDGLAAIIIEKTGVAYDGKDER